jgi:hypothetical protein
VTNASSGWSNSWRAERGVGKEKQRGYARFRQLMESMDLSKPPVIWSNHRTQVAIRIESAGAEAGAIKDVERNEGLEAMAEHILEPHSAGSLTDENVRWTDLKPLQLAQELSRFGYEMCRNTAAKLLNWPGIVAVLCAKS